MGMEAERARVTLPRSAEPRGMKVRAAPEANPWLTGARRQVQAAVGRRPANNTVT